MSAAQDLRQGRRPSRLRRAALALVTLAALILLAALWLGAPGKYDRFARTALVDPTTRVTAPSWTRPCRPIARFVVDKPFCVRVRGRVVWIQKRDPDGDGDRHLVVVARLHVRIVKLSTLLPVARLPHVGSTVTAVGWLMKGASGRAEIDAERLDADGHTYLSPYARPTRRGP